MLPMPLLLFAGGVARLPPGIVRRPTSTPFTHTLDEFHR
jgi:hypothetical protein